MTGLVCLAFSGLTCVEFVLGVVVSGECKRKSWQEAKGGGVEAGSIAEILK